MFTPQPTSARSLPRDAHGTDAALEPQSAGLDPLDRHHAAVDEAEVKIGEARVDLDRAAHQPGGEERHRVLTRSDRVEKQTCRASTDPRAQKLVDLDQHRPGNHQLPPQLGHERGDDAVRPVATVCRRDQRAVSATTLSAR